MNFKQLSAFLFASEDWWQTVMRKDHCRISTQMLLEVDYLNKLIFVNVNFSMQLKYCFSLHMKSRPIICEPFFSCPEWKKLSLIWMFTKCLQSIFAQVLVTVKVMKPVTTCGVLWYLWKSKCMCCKMCIEINYVHVTCNVLIALSFMIIQLHKSENLRRVELYSKNLNNMSWVIRLQKACILTAV